MTTFLTPGRKPGTFDEIQPVTVSTGAADAGKIPALKPNGRFDESVLPLGIGADTTNALAFEALSAGDFVNVYYEGGVRYARKAFAVDATKPTSGFVRAAFAVGETAQVYTSGINNVIANVTTAGPELVGSEICLSATLPGSYAVECPAAGIVQPLGRVIDVDATNIVIDFEPKTIVVRA